MPRERPLLPPLRNDADARLARFLGVLAMRVALNGEGTKGRRCPVSFGIDIGEGLDPCEKCEELEAENERLREALKTIEIWPLDYQHLTGREIVVHIRQFARGALTSEGAPKVEPGDGPPGTTEHWRNLPSLPRDEGAPCEACRATGVGGPDGEQCVSCGGTGLVGAAP